MEGWRIENCVLYVCVAAMVIGLYLMGAGLHSFWSFLLLLWANFPKKAKE